MDTTSALAWSAAGLTAAAGAWAAWGGRSPLLPYPTTPVRSRVDGETYVVRALPDKQEAADRLARLRARVVTLLQHLKTKHEAHPITVRLVANFDAQPHRFAESTPDAAHTSYSVNKGEKVFMCLRQRGGEVDDVLVEDNVLAFVALHELAHIGTSEVGHTRAFWDNFAWLLERAEAAHVYTYTDFAAHPVPYCGIAITDAPKHKGGPEAAATSTKASTAPSAA